jgi:hypothetical protein
MGNINKRAAGTRRHLSSVSTSCSRSSGVFEGPSYPDTLSLTCCRGVPAPWAC